MCHDGHGVKISPTFLRGGDGFEDVGWKAGFVVKCSHMKKSADGVPLTPSRRAGNGPRGTVVNGAVEDQFCCWASRKDIIWDPLEEMLAVNKAGSYK